MKQIQSYWQGRPTYVVRVKLRLALVGATVIPATGESPIENAVLLLDGGRIVSVGSADTVVVPKGYKVRDVSGKWITPGLIDTNVHLILMIVPEFYVKYEDRLEEIAIQSAQVGLKYGMTTMADTWGPLNPLLAARDRINSGELVGSRVLVAGNIVGLGGPFSSYFMGSWDARGMSLRNGDWVHPDIKSRINALWEAGMGPELMALTPEEIAQATREYVELGVDMIKVAVSGHGITPVEPLMFSREQLAAMRDVAKETGVLFATHSFTIESLRMSVELEPDLLLHPNVMNPSLATASPAQRTAIHKLIREIADKKLMAGVMAIPEREQLRIYQEWDSSENEDGPGRLLKLERPSEIEKEIRSLVQA